VYDGLKEIAHYRLSGIKMGETLNTNTTALVHEACRAMLSVLYNNLTANDDELLIQLHD